MNVKENLNQTRKVQGVTGKTFIGKLQFETTDEANYLLKEIVKSSTVDMYTIVYKIDSEDYSYEQGDREALTKYLEKYASISIEDIEKEIEKEQAEYLKSVEKYKKSIGKFIGKQLILKNKEIGEIVEITPTNAYSDDLSEALFEVTLKNGKKYIRNTNLEVPNWK